MMPLLRISASSSRHYLSARSGGQPHTLATFIAEHLSHSILTPMRTVPINFKNGKEVN
jgi:hypothetical protein